MTYQIGQRLPASKDWSLNQITGARLPHSEWYAMHVWGGREARARDLLARLGVHAQYPVYERCWRPEAGPRKGKQTCQKYPAVSGLIYARFRDAPRWHVIKRRQIITGVVGRDGHPIALPDDVIKQIMGLPTEAERLEQERIEAARVIPGGKGRILAGPFGDFVVDVGEVRDGRVWFSINDIKGSVAQDGIERVDPARKVG